MSLTPRDAAIHLGLFAASCATCWMVGGPYHAFTLMGILACHEAGHYWLGRRHGVPVSLPYFIPLPPYGTFGTLGAVIRMDEPIADRNPLFDVGASGPIAGLVVAVPLLAIGLQLSELGPLTPGASIEGNSVLYALLKYAAFGRWLPADGVDVILHPMALAAWVGLLVTMINLLPLGQLDGGHIARAALGQGHEAWSRRLHLALPVVGLAIGGIMTASALAAGHPLLRALYYGSHGLGPWLVWALVLWWMRDRAGEYHPPVGDVVLDPGRRRAAIAMLVVFALIFTPVPFRPVL